MKKKNQISTVIIHSTVDFNTRVSLREIWHVIQGSMLLVNSHRENSQDSAPWLLALDSVSVRNCKPTNLSGTTYSQFPFQSLDTRLKACTESLNKLQPRVNNFKGKKMNLYSFTDPWEQEPCYFIRFCSVTQSSIRLPRISDIILKLETIKVVIFYNFIEYRKKLEVLLT